MIKVTAHIQCPEKPFVVALILSGSVCPNQGQATVSFLQGTGHFIVLF